MQAIPINAVAVPAIVKKSRKTKVATEPAIQALAGRTVVQPIAGPAQPRSTASADFLRSLEDPNAAAERYEERAQELGYAPVRARRPRARRQFTESDMAFAVNLKDYINEYAKIKKYKKDLALEQFLKQKHEAHQVLDPQPQRFRKIR